MQHLGADIEGSKFPSQVQSGLSIFMSVVESAIFLHRHGMLHGSSIRASDSKKLSKLLKKADSDLGTALELSPEHSFHARMPNMSSHFTDYSFNIYLEMLLFAYLYLPQSPAPVSICFKRN